MTENQKKLIQTMLAMQAGFNATVNKDWKTANLPFTDAIWTEAGEAFDYTHWPWWKKAGQAIRFDRIRMEVVDVWHFLMSELMTYDEAANGTYVDLIEVLYDDSAKKAQEIKDKIGNVEMIREQLRNLIRASLLKRDETRPVLLVAAFFAVVNVLGMDLDQLYKLYVGKNTLNSFRQANGYKKETERYLTIWAAESGVEDNDYLTEILEESDITKDIDDLKAEITTKLQKQFDANLALFVGEEVK